MANETTMYLAPAFFSERERVLARYEGLTATGYRYDSGVCSLRLENGVGRVELLPFQGQQIWSAEFNGRPLTMKGMFTEPRATRAYLENYGGFLLHCGFTAMGVPGVTDTHPLHGELPNAPYQRAWIVAGSDEKGAYIGLGGQYQHTVAFSYNYVAEPLVKLYAGSTIFSVSMTVRNLKRSPMEYMYLAHINFRPVDNARLVYSALCTPEHVRVRRSIPSHVHPLPGYAEFLDELGRHPEKHHVLSPGLLFDPEVAFAIDYLADEAGWAHTLQMHPDGQADYVRHRPSQLGIGVRWICRTADQDALGMVLPATAEPEGYSAEKAKGNIKVLAAQSEFRGDMEVGTLSPAEAEKVEAGVKRILGA